jgi:hypothetical protein
MEEFIDAAEKVFDAHKRGALNVRIFYASRTPPRIVLMIGHDSQGLRLLRGRGVPGAEGYRVSWDYRKAGHKGRLGRKVAESVSLAGLQKREIKACKIDQHDAPMSPVHVADPDHGHRGRW